MLIFLLQIIVTLIGASTTSSIPITVVDTFQLPSSAAIEDISHNWTNNTLAVRSNEAGKIYVVNASTYVLEDSIDLPADCTGFGLGVTDNSTYYINSDTAPLILYSDGDGTWDEYINPAGTQGAGMDCYSNGLPIITQLNSNPSHMLYAFQLEDSTSASYPFQGVTDEISGYMAHDVMTQTIYPPFATITTTRFGHEFYFHYLNSSDEYYLYGQEPTPIPVTFL